MLNKRSFMMGAAGTLAAPGVLACGGRASSAALPSLGEASTGKQAWAAYLQQSFELRHEAGACRVTLCSLQALRVGDSHAAQVTEQFALGFVGDEEVRLPSGVYEVTHDNGQSAELYLVNAGTGAKLAMRADFNLLG